MAEGAVISQVPEQWREHNAIHGWKPIALYYALACGLSWAIWSPVVLGSEGLNIFHHSFSFPVFVSIGTLGPLCACFVAQRYATGSWRAVRLLPASRSQLVWLVFGPFSVLFVFFFLFPAFLTKGGPVAWRWHISALAGIFVPIFNYNLFGGPLFEEFGWRGFLQCRLQSMMPPWIAAILVGIMWGAWHFPLLLLSWSSASPASYVFILIGLSVLMAFAFNASGRAVVVAILMHSAFNASSPFLPAYLESVPTRGQPSAETLIGLAFLLPASAIIFFTRGRLAVQPSIQRTIATAGNAEVVPRTAYPDGPSTEDRP